MNWDSLPGFPLFEKHLLPVERQESLAFLVVVPMFSLLPPAIVVVFWDNMLARLIKVAQT